MVHQEITIVPVPKQPVAYKTNQYEKSSYTMEPQRADLPEPADFSILPASITFDYSGNDDAWHSAAVNVLLECIRDLQADHTSGAKALATKAVSSLVRIAEIVGRGLIENPRGVISVSQPESGVKSRKFFEAWWDVIRRAGRVICRYGRPSMGAAITVAVVDALDRERLGFEGKCNTQPRELGTGDIIIRSDFELIEEGIERMRNYIRKRVDGDQSSIGLHLRQYIREKFHHDLAENTTREVVILTLSFSSAILKAIMAMLESERSSNGNGDGCLRIRLKIMESRPLFEGVDFARTLVSSAYSKDLLDNLSIEIASDASVAILEKDVDVVFFGADRISELGDVSNKTGSLPAVLCAKTVSDNVSVIALSEIEKVAKPGTMDDHREEENDVRELTKAWEMELPDGITTEMWNAAVKIRNVYFEWVPVQYIDYYICETGILSREDIKARSQCVLGSELRVFGDLEHSDPL